MGKGTEPRVTPKMREAIRRVAVAKAPTAASTVAAKKKEQPLGPTPEQAHSFVVEGLGQKRRHKRIAYIETLALSPLSMSEPKGPRLLTRDQLLALRTYRERFDQSQASLTRCALDVTDRGGGPDVVGLPAVLFTAWEVKAADAAMGAVANTVRAVTLHDMDFSAVAIQRFGSRLHSYQTKKNGPTRTREVPRSGRHREIIRNEFLLGVDRLERALRPYLRTGG